MVVVINETGSVFDEQTPINGREYMNPETGEMLDNEEITAHQINTYLQRCSVDIPDGKEKNNHLNLDGITA